MTWQSHPRSRPVGDRVKLVDTNVLIYAVDSSSPHHRLARDWLDRALSGGAPVGFAWLALIGFVRLATHPSITPRPLGVATALDVVDAWLGARSAQVLHPGPRHAELLRRMLETGRYGNLANDAHLAALAAEHRATIVSFDSDFRQFPSIRWELPH